MLRILFLGSHLQSYRCFKYLIKNFSNKVEIVAVGPHNSKTDIREDQDILPFAQSLGIKTITYDEIINQEFDLGISLLYDRVLNKNHITIPKRGWINFHLGPLPKFRGSNSVMHALILARKENNWNFGVTTHYIEEKVDTGPIIDKIDIPIFEDDTAFSLHTRSSDKIFDLFVRNIENIINSKDRVKSKPQIGSGTLFKKGIIDHYVDLNLPETEVYDKVRALTFPGKPRAFTIIGNKKIYLTLEEK